MLQTGGFRNYRASNGMRTILCKLILASFIVVAFNAAAITRYVDLNNPNPTPPYSDWATAATNIQDAIDIAIDSDVVLVTNGIYGVGGRVVYGTLTNRVALTKPITLKSVNGASVTVIQGNKVLGNNAVRCVFLTNGATISGFTLTNGATQNVGDLTQEQNGGAGWCESTNAFILNCRIAGSFAANVGGGVFGGTLSNCLVTANLAKRAGGGVSTCVIYDSTISGNSVPYEAAVPVSLDGGGAHASSLSNCVVIGNSASDGGGGAVDSTLRFCTIASNILSYTYAFGGGGVLRCVLNDCLLKGNNGREGGGAAASALTNCIVTTNTATWGGGIANSAAANCEISGNEGGSQGGGAHRSTLNNCLVRWNRANNGGGTYLSTVFGSTIVRNRQSNSGMVVYGSFVNCIIYNSSSGENYTPSYPPTFNFCCTTPIPASGAGNFDGLPMFVDIPGGNFRLQANSPCINSGAAAYSVSDYDLDRNPRISGGALDIGAFEFQSPASVLSYAWAQRHGFPVNGSADFSDADGDGANNWQEWRADTIPTNSLSALRLVSATNSPGGAVVTWQSVATRNYWLERATNLGVVSPFQTIATNIIGTAGTKTFTDTTVAGDGLYLYRIGVQ